MITKEPIQDKRMDKVLLKTSEAAELCSVSEVTIRRWLKNEGCPSVMIGGSRRICPDQLRDWIRERQKKQETS